MTARSCWLELEGCSFGTLSLRLIYTCVDILAKLGGYQMEKEIMYPYFYERIMWDEASKPKFCVNTKLQDPVLMCIVCFYVNKILCLNIDKDRQQLALYHVPIFFFHDNLGHLLATPS